MTEERLAEIKEHLEGTAIIGELYVKGDPWKGYEVIDDHNGMRIAELSNGTEAQFLANAPKDISELVAEVEFLLAVRDGQARMIQKLHAENRGYVAEIAQLRKTLEFYADRKHYGFYTDASNNCPTTDVLMDDGYQAKEALRYGD